MRAFSWRHPTISIGLARSEMDRRLRELFCPHGNERPIDPGFLRLQTWIFHQRHPGTDACGIISFREARPSVHPDDRASTAIRRGRHGGSKGQMVKAVIRWILGVEAEPLQDVAAKYLWAVP